MPKPGWKVRAKRPKWHRVVNNTDDKKVTQSLVLTRKEYEVSGETIPESKVHEKLKDIVLAKEKKAHTEKNLKLQFEQRKEKWIRKKQLEEQTDQALKKLVDKYLKVDQQDILDNMRA